MSAPLRGAIAGFGNVAENGHLPGWQARDDVRLVAVLEPDAARRERAQALLPDAKPYASATELFAEARPDFVDIAAPPALHAPLIGAAAAAGAHVLCEKPLVVSLDELRSARAAAARAGVVLYTVHNWVFSEPFRRVRRLLDEGAIGELTEIEFETVRDGCARSVGSDWRTARTLSGGGILVDHGWHAFYMMLALVKESPRAVRARLARRRYLEADVEDTAACEIEFPSLVARLSLTWAGRERRTRWRLRGRSGEIEVVDDRLTVRRAGGGESAVLAESLTAGSHHPEWFGGVVDGFLREIREPATRGRNLAEAEQCLRLLSAAYASDASAGQARALADVGGSPDEGHRSEPAIGR